MKQFYIKILAICLLIGSASCSSSKTLIPNGRNKTINNVYGAYIIIYKDTTNIVKGELLAIDSTYTYVLTDHGSHITLNKNIKRFNIVLTDNYSRYQANFMGISAIPSALGMIMHPDFADGFAFLAIGIAVFGGAGSGIESIRDGQVVSFPEYSNNLQTYCRYARFPGGLPNNVDIKTFVPWWDKISYGSYNKRLP